MTAHGKSDGTVTLYHASPVWFERPDIDFAGIGDGRSMSGLGFNMAEGATYCREHLENRSGSEVDGVVFSVDVPLEGVADWGARLDAELLDRSTRRAVELGMADLAGDLGRLRGAMATGSDFVQPDYYVNGAERREDMRRATNGLIRDLVTRSLPDQRLWNEFMVGMGVNVTKSAYVWVAIDPTVLGPLRVHEIVGKGARGMPEGVRPGDLAARPGSATTSRLDTGDLRSENLTDAWRCVRSLGDARLEANFRKVAKILVSDDYVQKADPAARRTLGQSYGFDLRDAVGRAIRETLSPWLSQADVAAAPARVAERMERVSAFARDSVNDPRLNALLWELDSAAQLHAARAARRTAAPQAPSDTMLGDMQRAGVGHRLSPLAHAIEAIEKAASAEEAGTLPKGTVATLRSRVEGAFRLADAAPDGTAQDRIAFPLAAEIAARFGRQDWLESVQHAVVHALRAFAPRPPPVADVAPEALRDAAEGRFELLQNHNHPIAGHPGWTVMQKGGAQLISHDGKLASFDDAGSGLSVPAVVSADGTALDVRYENGEQIRTRIAAGAAPVAAPVRSPAPR